MLLRIILILFLIAPNLAAADKGEMALSEITPAVITYFHRGWYTDVVECFDAKVAEINKQTGQSNWFVIYDDRVDHIAFEDKASGDFFVCSRVP